jgi:hypothetical protein
MSGSAAVHRTDLMRPALSVPATTWHQVFPMKTFLLRCLFCPAAWKYREAARRRRAGLRWLALAAAICIGAPF